MPKSPSEHARDAYHALGHLPTHRLLRIVEQVLLDRGRYGVTTQCIQLAGIHEAAELDDTEASDLRALLTRVANGQDPRSEGA